jgi:hypothetical protein
MGRIRSGAVFGAARPLMRTQDGGVITQSSKVICPLTQLGRQSVHGFAGGRRLCAEAKKVIRRPASSISFWALHGPRGSELSIAQIDDLVSDPKGLRLIRAFIRIGNAELRRRIVILVQEIADGKTRAGR